MASSMLRHRAGVSSQSQATYMQQAIKYGTHVTTKLPVVKRTTLMAFHLLRDLLERAGFGAGGGNPDAGCELDNAWLVGLGLRGKWVNL